MRRILKQECLIKEAVDFKDLIDHILTVRAITIEHLAVALDESVDDLIALRENKKLLNRKALTKLCCFYAEACFTELLER